MDEVDRLLTLYFYPEDGLEDNDFTSVPNDFDIKEASAYVKEAARLGVVPVDLKKVVKGATKARFYLHRIGTIEFYLPMSVFTCISTTTYTTLVGLRMNRFSDEEAVAKITGGDLSEVVWLTENEVNAVYETPKYNTKTSDKNGNYEVKTERLIKFLEPEKKGVYSAKLTLNIEIDLDIDGKPRTRKFRFEANMTANTRTSSNNPPYMRNKCIIC